MSRSTDQLLWRNGRNQFGDPGEGRARPVTVRTATDDAMWALHAELNDQLVERFGAQWLARYAGKARRQVWEDFRRGHWERYALSTFSKMVKEFNSYDSFLLYWLLTDKRFGLTLLDVPGPEIDAEMAKYEECGRYMVSYGGSHRKFETKDWRNHPKKRWLAGVGLVDAEPLPVLRPSPK